MTSLSIPRPTYPSGVWSWITTIDHKRIGILYGVTAFVLFLTGGVEAFLTRDARGWLYSGMLWDTNCRDVC